MANALSSAQANSVTTSAVSRLLRGGRVTKWKGKAASCAPWIGADLAASLAASVSSAALSAALAFGGAMLGAIPLAEAGSCTAGPVSVCSGAAGADVTQVRTGTPLAVTTAAGFGINTAVGNALTLTGTNGTTVTDANTSTISGAANGLLVRNLGTGALSVTTTGVVTGVTNVGLYGRNANTGNGLTISAGGNVSGGTAGVFGFNYGAGAVNVTTLGTVTGGTLNGIWVTNRGGVAATSLVVTARGNVTANGVAGVSGNGILSVNTGTGIHTVTAYGTITATRDGIRANNGGIGYAVSTGTTLTVDARNTITAGRDGINARNYSANGVMSITTSAAAQVTGSRNGIFAQNSGGESLTINTAADVTGTSGYGIVTQSGVNSTDMTITTVNTSGGQSGIGVSHGGTGALSITSTGAANGTIGYGIRAYNFSGTDLTIDAVDTNGGLSGIHAVNLGSGTLSVTSTGTATGTINDGIRARNRGTDLTIDAVDVNGGVNGIYAFNYGSGTLSVTATGTVTGTTRDGIYAMNYTNGGVVDIDARDDVSGGRNGILALHYGIGHLSVTTTGTVTGTTSDGIYAKIGATGTDLTVNAVDTNGGENGIVASHSGSGLLTVTSTGTATGTSYYGIWTDTFGAGDAFIINSGITQGGVAGIYATSYQGRTTTISNTGTVRNLAASSTSLAIQSVGTLTNINNSNLVLGTVALGGLADTFTNSAAGLWNTAGGVNDFGGGVDGVNNSGLVLAANNNGLAETTTFNNLETFQINAGGALRMNDGAVGDRTVLTGGGGAGNFAGNGGGIYVDTLLNAGGNPFADSDVLVIGGDSSGSSTLFVSATGAGALTPGDGILVVQVDGASNGAFSLGNAPLTAGAFIYKLFQNGLADPTNGDWYLRSNFLPTIPTYESYANVLLGLNTLPTLQQRVGNRFWAGEGNVVIAQGDGGPNSAPEAAPSPEEAAASVFIEENAIWTRIAGAHGHYEPDVSTAGSQFDASQWRAQAGVDFMLTENGDGKLIGGLTAHYGQASADVAAAAGNGSIDATGAGLGATLTWYGNNGFYADAQASYSWYDSDLASDDFGASVTGNDGSGYALSIETGKRIALNNGWTTTPQAQLVYSKVDFDDFTGPIGELVALQQAESLKGRLGITADREASWQGDGGDLRRSHVYAIANLHYEFLDGAQVNVAGTSFSQRQDRLWGELGLGGSYNWADDKYSLYGEADISTSLANFADSYELSGTAGFRVKF